MSAKNLLVLLAVSIMLSACSKPNPAQQIKSAKEYLNKGDLKSASIQIKNALQVDSGMAEARFLLGTILLSSGNANAAEIEFRKALSAHYSADITIPVLARSMLLSGQNKQIIDEFGKLDLVLPVSNASLKTVLSAAYRNINDTVNADAVLGAARAVDPTYSPAALTEALQKAQRQDFNGAMVIVETVAAKDKSNPEAWKLKGDLLVARGQLDDSITAYRKSIEVAPLFEVGEFALLEALLRKRDLDGAAAQLEHIEKVDAKNRQIDYYRAMLAYEKQDFKQAKIILERFLAGSTNNAFVLQLAGAVELGLNSFSLAESYLSRALKVAPTLPEARSLLITTYLRAGAPARALATLNEGESRKNIELPSLALAGEVYLQNGDLARAREYYTRALKLEPQNPVVRAGLALTQLAGGGQETSFRELQKLADEDGGTAAYMVIIREALARKDFDRAMKAVDKLEQGQPPNPVAMQLRGEIQVIKLRRVEARDSFARALVIDPGYFNAVASLAAMDMVDGKPTDAQARFESFLSKHPKNVNALMALTRLALARNAKTEEIVGLLTRAIDADSQDLRPRLILTELYLKVGDMKRAINLAQSAASAWPDRPEVLDMLGRVQLASGEANQAVYTFTNLMSFQPASAQARMRLAAAQMAAHDRKDAQDNLLKALEMQPDYLDAQRALLMVALEDNRPQDALKIARTVQQQRPMAYIGYALEGEVLASQRQWSAASTAYRASLQHGNDTEIAIKLHRTMRAMSSAEAATFSADWMKEHPRDSLFLTYLGQAAIARKDYLTAEKLHLLLIQIQPENAVAFNNLAWVTDELGKPGALAYAEQAVALAPGQPAFLDTLAKVLADKQNYAKAIELQSKALELQPDSSGLRMNLAKIYLKAGNREKARLELQTLAKLGGKLPNHSEVSELLRTL